MGTLVGHVAPGFVFLVIGLWHLFNHIKLHAIHPTTYTSLPWFPTSIMRHLELFLIMASSFVSIAMELFVGPHRHHPFDPDFTIPSNHLHNFEHSLISTTFIVYAVFTLLLDRYKPNAHYGLSQLLACVVFAQELLLFHLHSTDHEGIEGQYHMILQILVFISLSTTLLGIGYPNSFLISYVRSISILFQGLWLMVMGFMLWTPQFIPKGCFMNLEDGHYVVRCHSNAALHRGKSLVNIEFSCYLVGVTIFALSFYLALVKFYQQNIEYQSLMKFQVEEGEEIDVEDQRERSLRESNCFPRVAKTFSYIEIER